MGFSRVDPESWVKTFDDLCPRRKDLIEFDRGLYHHWAMYVGKWDGKRRMVVHFNPDDQEKVGLGWVDGSVTVDGLMDVADSSKMRVNNIIDASSRDWSEIEDIITKLVDLAGCKYSLTTNNCENFVTYLRYEAPSGFRSQKSGGILSYFSPTWHIGTYDNGKIQTEQWNEYVCASEENRRPRRTIPKIFYT